MSRRIGGRIDAQGLQLLAGHVDDDEYRRRANLNQPGIEGVRREALRLLAQGLQPRDVAAALRVGEDQIAAWANQGDAV